MARPLSDEKYDAILAAATRIIAAEGVSAPTAKIARDAGIAGGTLFTYFATKDTLLNALYRSLKADIADAIMDGYPDRSAALMRTRHVWDRYIDWGIREGTKRQTMAQLAVSHRVSRDAMEDALEPLLALDTMLADCADGSTGLTNGHVAAIMTALANVTIDFAERDPANAASHIDLGFAAFWRAVGEQ